jgi:hypothetical protein
MSEKEEKKESKQNCGRKQEIFVFKVIKVQVYQKFDKR